MNDKLNVLGCFNKKKYTHVSDCGPSTTIGVAWDNNRTDGNGTEKHSTTIPPCSMRRTISIRLRLGTVVN